MFFPRSTSLILALALLACPLRCAGLFTLGAGVENCCCCAHRAADEGCPAPAEKQAPNRPGRCPGCICSGALVVPVERLALADVTALCVELPDAVGQTGLGQCSQPNRFEHRAAHWFDALGGGRAVCIFERSLLI